MPENDVSEQPMHHRTIKIVGVIVGLLLILVLVVACTQTNNAAKKATTPRVNPSMSAVATPTK